MSYKHPQGFPDPENPPIALIEGLSKAEIKAMKRKIRMEAVSKHTYFENSFVYRLLAFNYAAAVCLQFPPFFTVP